MPAHDIFVFADEQQPRRLALFAGVFVAGLVGGVVFTSTLAHSQQARSAYIGQVSATSQADLPAWSADPSVPEAGAALRDIRQERPEAISPTF